MKSVYPIANALGCPRCLVTSITILIIAFDHHQVRVLVGGQRVARSARFVVNELDVSASALRESTVLAILATRLPQSAPTQSSGEPVEQGNWPLATRITWMELVLVVGDDQVMMMLHGTVLVMMLP